MSKIIESLLFKTKEPACVLFFLIFALFVGFHLSVFKGLVQSNDRGTLTLCRELSGSISAVLSWVNVHGFWLTKKKKGSDIMTRANVWRSSRVFMFMCTKVATSTD